MTVGLRSQTYVYYAEVLYIILLNYLRRICNLI
jgi:hypothetical protein